MIRLWIIAAGIAAAAAGLGALRARRRKSDPEYTTEPVSTQWLAEARGHEDPGW